MKIIVIGGTGTIGSAVANELKKRHDLIIVGRKHADLICDIESLDSIKHMYEQASTFHAVVVTAGNVHFDTLANMDESKYAIGLKSKLMGQVNLVLAGIPYIQPQGSFTLTSGILGYDPIVAGSSAAMVNGAIDSFVKSAAIELDRGLRINAVSPIVLVESMDSYAPFFRGFEPVPAAKVALAYAKSVEGKQTGQVYKVG